MNLTPYRETEIQVHEVFNDDTKDKYKVVWQRHDFKTECTVEIWLQRCNSDPENWQRLFTEKISDFFLTPNYRISIEKIKSYLRINSI